MQLKKAFCSWVIWYFTSSQSRRRMHLATFLNSVVSQAWMLLLQGGKKPRRHSGSRLSQPLISSFAVSNMYCCFMMPHHTTKTLCTCCKPGIDWLWNGEGKVGFISAFLGNKSHTHTTHTHTCITPPHAPLICGPWNKGADEQPLSADAILDLSSVACLVTEKQSRELMASPFKGSSPDTAYSQIPSLSISLCSIYYSHLDNILSDRPFSPFK